MAWYWIVLIVLAVLVGLLFVTFLTNGDGKLIEIVYDWLQKYHDSKAGDGKI